MPFEFQFIYVLVGKVEVLTLNSVTHLKRSEGIFINKNVVHTVRKVIRVTIKALFFSKGSFILFRKSFGKDS